MLVVLNSGAIRAARLASNKTLRAAAAALGVSKTTLVNTETGASKPGSELLGRMAQLYGVDMDSFFGHPTETIGSETSLRLPSNGGTGEAQ